MGKLSKIVMSDQRINLEFPATERGHSSPDSPGSNVGVVCVPKVKRPKIPLPEEELKARRAARVALPFITKYRVVKPYVVTYEPGSKVFGKIVIDKYGRSGGKWYIWSQDPAEPRKLAVCKRRFITLDIEYLISHPELLQAIRNFQSTDPDNKSKSGVLHPANSSGSAAIGSGITNDGTIKNGPTNANDQTGQRRKCG